MDPSIYRNIYLYKCSGTLREGLFSVEQFSHLPEGADRKGGNRIMRSCWRPLELHQIEFLKTIFVHKHHNIKSLLSFKECRYHQEDSWYSYYYLHYNITFNTNIIIYPHTNTYIIYKC